MDLGERNHWLEKCKNLMRESRGKDVIKALEKLTPKPGKEAREAVAKAIKYLRKREKKGQLDYAKALEEDLPDRIWTSGKRASSYPSKAAQNRGSLVASGKSRGNGPTPSDAGQPTGGRVLEPKGRLTTTFSYTPGTSKGVPAFFGAGRAR